jgi:ATP synthase protein I
MVLEKRRGKSKEQRDMVQGLTLVTQLGLTMAGCIVFCFAVGYYLDKFLGTKGIFITIFILLGVVGGGVTVYRQITDLFDDETKKRSNE